MSKKFLSIALAMVLGINLFGCASQTSVSATEAPTTKAETTIEETVATEEVVEAISEKKDYNIAVVVKLKGIDYFTTFEEGVKKFADEFGINAHVEGNTTADPTEQVNLIENIISAGNVDALCVVPNDPAALENVLKKAQEKGIKVVCTESPDQENMDYDVEMIINDMFAELIAEDAAKRCEGKGQYALFVGGLTVALHNAWADHVEEYLAEKYPEMTLCTERVACGEDKALAQEKTKELLATYPDLNCFICFGSQGPLGAAEALIEQDLVGKVTVVGNILPSEGGKYLENGAISTGYLWNPADSGYASCYIAKDLLDGKTIDKNYKIPGMEEVNLQNKTLWINNPIVITAENWQTFGF